MPLPPGPKAVTPLLDPALNKPLPTSAARGRARKLPKLRSMRPEPGGACSSRSSASHSLSPGPAISAPLAQVAAPAVAAAGAIATPRPRFFASLPPMPAGPAEAAEEDEPLQRTPRPRRRGSRLSSCRSSREDEGDDDISVGSSELDESLAQAARSLDLTCDRGTELSTGDMLPSGARGTGMSGGWSPASVPGGGGQRRQSMRRSISDLSQLSARMTPKEFEQRGLGVPWQKPAAGLCHIDTNHDEANRALEFCLLPSPMLGGQRSACTMMQCSPSTPSSPGGLQRRFLDRVHRASLGEATPTSMSGLGSGGGGGEGRSSSSSGAPAPPLCPELPVLGAASMSMGFSPMQRVPRCRSFASSGLGGDLEELGAPSHMGSASWSSSSAFSPDPRPLSVGNGGSRAPMQLHTAFRAQERERMQLSGCRVQPSIAKVRKTGCGGGGALLGRAKSQNWSSSSQNRSANRMPLGPRSTAVGKKGIASAASLDRPPGRRVRHLSAACPTGATSEPALPRSYLR
mmetsp:Transcript_7129/g.20162  ORF Transcript_7129/g.20162 Transcript_7129/m.20162 type:complete len:516 (+) Transcript_7129:47-1594(+)